jgi:hypothetical protein
MPGRARFELSTVWRISQLFYLLHSSWLLGIIFMYAPVYHFKKSTVPSQRLQKGCCMRFFPVSRGLLYILVRSTVHAAFRYFKKGSRYTVQYYLALYGEIVTITLIFVFEVIMTLKLQF